MESKAKEKNLTVRKTNEKYWVDRKHEEQILNGRGYFKIKKRRLR